MAKKSLGYVELEWTCPTCDARNPGTVRTCQGCGLPMPPDVEFQAPSQTEILDQDEVGTQAEKAPDIHCPYCDARNTADAKTCVQCGGALDEGEQRQAGTLVAGFTTEQKPPIKCPACGAENAASNYNCESCGSPLPAAQANRPTAEQELRPATAGSGRSCMMIIGIIALAAVLGVGWLIYQGSQRTSAIGSVVDTQWTRTIEMEGLLPREYSAWLDEIPDDATIGQCTEQVRDTVSEPVENARETCGTPYAVDQGTGIAEVVQDCEYEILASWCEYTINEWQETDALVLSGSGFSPEWPAFQPSESLRQGERNESFTCIFSYDDNTYRYRASSFEEFQRCTPGSRWDLEINGNGRVVSAIPADQE